MLICDTHHHEIAVAAEHPHDIPRSGTGQIEQQRRAVIHARDLHAGCPELGDPAERDQVLGALEQAGLISLTSTDQGILRWRRVGYGG